MSDYEKPLPVPDEYSSPYWQAAAEGRLILQKCQPCGTYQNYPRGICSKCHRPDLAWVDASGRGTVYTFTNIYRAPNAFAKDVPYTLAIVELDEGIHMMTNVVQCEPEDVKIGMPVEVVFEQVAANIGMPKFKPLGASRAHQ